MENLRLNKFYNRLKQEIEDAEEGSIQEILTSIALTYLEEKKVISNVQRCTYISPPTVKKKRQVNAYSLDESYEQLDLFVTLEFTDDLIQTCTKKDLESIIARVFEFFKTAVNNDSLDYDESSPVYELAHLIKKNSDSFKSVRIFIFTNGLYPNRLPATEDVLMFRNIPIRYELYDLDRLCGLLDDKDSRMIHLNDDSLTCVKIPTTNTSEYEAYLAVVPATMLAEWYDTFQGQLLESNVRSYLTLTGKTNQGIRTTLQKEPEMFLAYNNGISATAQAVTCVSMQDGRSVIRTITDLQIVNGGQTTAVIHQVFKEKGKDKTDLSKVFVQMKLSVIKNIEKQSEIIAKISKYANKQNKVSEADFTSSNSFLIALEKVSRYYPAPVSQGTSVTYWFFERTRGQYNNELRLQIGAKQKRWFEQKTPKTQLFLKEDIAKYHNIWAQKPYFAITGNEKSYVEFIASLEKDKQKADDIFFEGLIAKLILYREAKIIYGDQRKKNAIGSMYEVTVPYSLAWLSHAIQNSNRVLNLSQIWKNQTISAELTEFLHELMFKVDKFIQLKTPEKLFKSWGKKDASWKSVKEQLFMDVSVLVNDLIHPDKLKLRVAKTEVYWQQLERDAQVRLVQFVPISDWNLIQVWGKKKNQLDDYQQAMIDKIKIVIETKKQFSDIQLKRGLEIMGLYSKAIAEVELVASIQQDLEYLKLTHAILEQFFKWHSRNQQLKWNEVLDLSSYLPTYRIWSNDDKKMIWSLIKRFKGIAFDI